MRLFSTRRQPGICNTSAQSGFQPKELRKARPYLRLQTEWYVFWYSAVPTSPDDGSIRAHFDYEVDSGHLRYGGKMGVWPFFDYAANHLHRSPLGHLNAGLTQAYSVNPWLPLGIRREGGVHRNQSAGIMEERCDSQLTPTQFCPSTGGHLNLAACLRNNVLNEHRHKQS